MQKFSKPWYRESRKTWYVTLDGRQINLGRDRKVAFAQYKQLLARPKKQRATSESLAVVIDAFLEWTQKARSPETYEWYRYRLQRFVGRHPDMRISDLRPYDVQQWVDSYELSNNSRRNLMRSIKRCLQWAVTQGYLDQSPIQHLELPGAERREIVVSQSEYETLVRLAGDDNLRDLLVVTWETGCRPQESLRVEARHVDIERSRWVFPESEGKTGVRIVYLTDEALAITQRQLLKYPSGKLFRNGDGRAWTTDAVNCGIRRIRERMGKAILEEQGVQLTAAEIEACIGELNPVRRRHGRPLTKTEAVLREEARKKLWKRKRAAVVPSYSLYALRHSWATHALERGVDPLTVAILMGHKDPSMLARVYQHLSHNPEHMLLQAKRAVG